MVRPTFDLTWAVTGSAEEVWDRLWDLRRHAAAIPLTTISQVIPEGRRAAAPGAANGLGPGARFVARTQLGPLGFDDVMLVRVWEPPRRAVIDKVGRVLRGRIEVSLSQTPGPGCPAVVIHWRQDYRVRHVPDRLAGLARGLVRTAYSRALQRITGPEPLA